MSQPFLDIFSYLLFCTSVLTINFVTESERKKFLDQLLYAQQELAAAKGREQALQEQLLKEVTESQERLRKQIQLNSELEVGFNFLYSSFRSRINLCIPICTLKQETEFVGVVIISIGLLNLVTHHLC